MVHAQTMKRALVTIGFIRMALFAQRESVNETFYDLLLPLCSFHPCLNIMFVRNNFDRNAKLVLSNLR